MAHQADIDDTKLEEKVRGTDLMLLKVRSQEMDLRPVDFSSSSSAPKLLLSRPRPLSKKNRNCFSDTTR